MGQEQGGMEQLFSINWEEIFVPQASVLEIIVRGSVIYLAIYLLLRFVIKREAGQVGITDLLLVVLIADAVQGGMSGGYTSITNSIVLASTIVFWTYFLDWLGYRFSITRGLMHPPPLLLVENGQLLHKNLHEEYLTEDELMSKLRERGVSDLSQVQQAFMESDGRISVIRKGTGDSLGSNI